MAKVELDSENIITKPFDRAEIYRFMESLFDKERCCTSQLGREV